MKSDNNSTLWAFIVWLVVVPPGAIYLVLTFGIQDINWLHIFVYTLFGFITLYYPIKRRDQPLFLIGWVTIPVFLKYGIVAEVIVMQLAIIAIPFSFENTSPQLTRFFNNSTLFFILSVISASIFHLAGGEIGILSFWPIILFGFYYHFSHIIFRDLIIKLYVKLKNKTSNYLSNKTPFDYAIDYGIIPFAITIYLLIEYVGFGAFYLLGIPFILIAYVLKVYNQTEAINSHLQRAGEIGHQLSNYMTEKKVIDEFVEKVSGLFNVEYAYLFDHQDGLLELIRSYENDEFIDVKLSKLSLGQGIAGTVLMWNKPVIYSNREEWKDVSYQYEPDKMQSVLCLPISRNANVEAVLFLSTRKKSAFQQFHLQILDILCSYFTVSVEKVRNVEEKVGQSERCALTKLYNYRFIEERLVYEMDRVNSGFSDELSVLMLDIDYFKKVNDMYGHQNGNEVLKMVARILSQFVPSNGIVGRYGGEEFAFILPGMSTQEAILLAEQIRLEIEQYSFQVYPSLTNHSEPILISITVSIGISTAPQDADDAKTMLSYADRSLYLGAKRAGRNRVAGYVK